MPEALHEKSFQHAVPAFLAKRSAISQALRAKLLGWLHRGFSVHNQVRVDECDAEGRKKLAGYRLRAPLALEKMTYDAATGTVIYRSKMHQGLKPNLQLMPGAQCRELLCRHIPDRYEHLVRHVGWCSNRAPPPTERSPPAQGADWPPGAAVPLTHHPVPDIA